MIVGGKPKHLMQRAGNSSGAKLPRAKARRAKHEPGRMNGLERLYARKLDRQLAAGKILAWRFEPFALRLADRTFYHFDFFVINLDLSMDIHETKGHWEDDARVKIKTAAELHPWFGFIALTRDRKRKKWKRERFGSAKESHDAGSSTHEEHQHHAPAECGPPSQAEAASPRPQRRARQPARPKDAP